MGWFGHRNHSSSLQRYPPQSHKVFTYPHRGFRKHTYDDVCRCSKLGSASTVIHTWGLGLSYSHTHPGKAEITSSDEDTRVTGHPAVIASLIEWESIKWWHGSSSSDDFSHYLSFFPNPPYRVIYTITRPVTVNIYWGLTLCQAPCYILSMPYLICPSNFMNEVLLISPYYRWGNWGQRSNLPSFSLYTEKLVFEAKISPWF